MNRIEAFSRGANESVCLACILGVEDVLNSESLLNVEGSIGLRYARAVLVSCVQYLERHQRTENRQVAECPNFALVSHHGKIVQQVDVVFSSRRADPESANAMSFTPSPVIERFYSYDSVTCLYYSRT
jgi:hypothetical protein